MYFRSVVIGLEFGTLAISVSTILTDILKYTKIYCVHLCNIILFRVTSPMRIPVIVNRNV